MFSLITSITLFYLIICLHLYLSQKKLLFKPTREILQTPSKVNLAFEDIYFDSTDGVRLNGWFIPSSPGTQCVLFCHGNARNISDRMELIQTINGLGLSLFIFDYRGYGLSTGSPSEDGLYQDSEAALNIVKSRGYSQENIILFGRSLGCAIASNLARSHQAKALILDSPFLSLPEVAAYHYPIFPVKLLVKMKFDNRINIKEVRIPVLIIHSENDEVIPFKHGQTIFNLANDPKKFVRIRGNHDAGFLNDLDGYQREISSFLENF